MKPITIVIPVRQGGNPHVTLESLAHQTFQDFDIVVSWDKKGNANSARNRGAALVHSPFVLFSDDDIRWSPGALELMYRVLRDTPQASYAYGPYNMPGIGVQCNRPFDADRLRRTNFISTMSLIRRPDFPGFDETLNRLQDWDLWLTMLERGKVGVYCGPQIIFETEKRNGLTYGSNLTWEQARAIVAQKHGFA
jgi:glycosyltransferase involved in cell wall biosynthesis